MNRVSKLCAVLALTLGAAAAAHADQMVVHNMTDRSVNFMIRCQAPARDWHPKTLSSGYKFVFNANGRCDTYGIQISTTERGAKTTFNYKLYPGSEYNIRYDHNRHAFNVFRR